MNGFYKKLLVSGIYKKMFLRKTICAIIAFVRKRFVETFFVEADFREMVFVEADFMKTDFMETV